MSNAAKWLHAFADMAAHGEGAGIARAFVEHGFWRDYVSFGWTLQTLEGRDAIAQLAADVGPLVGFRDPVFEGEASDTDGFFRFHTEAGTGRGHIRLDGERCATLFTMLDNLGGKAPAAGADSARPFVLVVGGGQGGLALGAQLGDLGVPYLIVDKHPRVGDQWRSRYDSLVLHDPVWYDHMPLKPFPEGWPVFTPKGQMGDWLEAYADDLDLNIWTSAALTGARYDADARCWRATVQRDGETTTLYPTHLVMALGLSGFPRVPEFAGQDRFAGPQMHSSEYKGGSHYAGQNVIVVGANNSAHDIAADLVSHGAKPTMIQRSSTLVVRQADYCEKVLGPLYSAEAVAAGITTDKADILQAAMPLRLMEPKHRAIWDGIRAEQSAFYQQLIDAGFCLDFAEDGTGLGMKYRRTASGYYIDVGGAAMVMDGRIQVRSGQPIVRLAETSVELGSGEVLPADAIVYATGYGGMTDWVAALIDTDTARRVGPCWGYGSDTKGDPGPWIGELRNMWMPTRADVQDPRPVHNDARAPLESLPPHLLDYGLTLGHQLELDHLLQLGQHLHGDDGGVGALVALQRERRHLRVQELAREVDERVRLRPLLAVHAEHGAVEGAVLALARELAGVAGHGVPLLPAPRRRRRHLGHPLARVVVGARPVPLGHVVQVAPLAQRLVAAHAAENQVGVVRLYHGLLLVDGQGLFPVVELLVPPLLHLDVARQVLVAPLQETGGGLFLSQLVVDGDQ
ncbi:MAG: NAD(P)/FAD-dependent oxidoreductase [Pseudomonadota bacterium]